MSLYLYLLERHDQSGYDTNLAHVICAESASSARKMAADAAADEGAYVWRAPMESRCRLIGEARGGIARSIVLSDFNAG